MREEAGRPVDRAKGDVSETKGSRRREKDRLTVERLIREGPEIAGIVGVRPHSV